MLEFTNWLSLPDTGKDCQRPPALGPHQEEECGLAAKWEARSREQCREEDVKKLRKHGMAPDINYNLKSLDNAIYILYHKP